MILALLSCLGLCVARPPLPATLVTPSGFTSLRTSGASSLHQVILPASSETPPFLVKLVGDRQQIGYDYAALLHNETVAMYTSFMGSMFNASEQATLNQFVDYCWANFLVKHVSQEFQDEIAGMKQFHTKFGTGADNITTDQVATRFYTLANMPADTQNIISMLEEELEKDWPVWLRVTVNEIIRLLEKILSGCDAFGVWGSRTKGGLLYSSRNLDWNKDTGINKYKLVTFYHITTANGTIPPYATTGFASGLGALAGMSSRGISVSEMNLDNSRVTFDGAPFPLRLRAVLEGASDLNTALRVWNATNNTNSFNFLIGSSPDALAGKDGAYALETIRGYTSVYGANSDREKDALYFCGPKGSAQSCSWTNETGVLSLGRPLVDAVWRTNHALDPNIMLTQERLFNDTVFRYNLMADLFTELEGTPIDDQLAASITATLGIKGPDFFSCSQDFHHGSVIMSVTYAPGPRPQAPYGYLYVAWEGGQGRTWTPASCMPFVRIDFAPWV